MEWVEELSQLQHSGIVDPVDGRTRPVIVLFVMDGAARRELTGRTSAASKHGLESNGMNADQIKDLSLAAPITLTPDIMKQAEPPPHMSMAQIKTRARDSSVGGIIGGNLLRCPPSRLLFDVLHINLRLVATSLKHTARALVLSKCDLAAFCSHLNKCCGVRARVLWLDDGSPEVCVSGNDCRKLLASGPGVVLCACGKHQFLPTGKDADPFRKALAAHWRLLTLVLGELGELDVDVARKQLPVLRVAALQLALTGSALFGPKFVTPTVRALADLVPHQQEVSHGQFTLCLMRAATHYFLLLASFSATVRAGFDPRPLLR